MRPVSEALESALREGRQPAYRILAYDPKLDNISSIVKGTATQIPFDLTDYCSSITWSVQQLSFVLSDSEGVFHPDTGTQKKFLVDGAIIRLKEGDVRVDESDWMWTFTGQIRGQIGWHKTRRTKVLESKVTVYSRENNQSWKRRKIITEEYTVGTDIGIMLRDICRNLMAMNDAEFRIPTVVGLQFRHHTNQMALVTPWEALGSILEAISCVPYFDGEGKLSYYNKNMNRSPDRILPDYIRVIDYEIPENNADDINKVKVIFLNSELTEVEGPYQCLGRAQITTGFFTSKETLVCWWSEDHKQRAKGSNMIIIKSINSGLLPVGTEIYQGIDEFHGKIEIVISVWVPILVTVMLAAYVAAACIPDDVITFGVGVEEGITIPIGRVIQAGAMVSIMLIMMCLGSGQYEIWGTPYDMAYLEERSIAIEDGINYWEENEKEIRNDFIGSFDQADAVAITELIWEKSVSLTRRLIIEDDLALEFGDILVLPDGRKFLISNLKKDIKRGEIPLLVLDGFKVMTA